MAPGSLITDNRVAQSANNSDARTIPDGPLSVTISVRGRFHAFDLARQLEQRGDLRCLITTYPKFKVREWQIPNSRIRNFVTAEFLNRGLSRTPFSPSTRERLRVSLAAAYDRAAARAIPDDTRLFVGWSSECVESLRTARALGARTIVERGSAHIRFQERILSEEYERIGLRWHGIAPGFIERSEQEYRDADYISVPSGFVRDTFLEYGIPAEKLIVVPYGCDLSVFKPRPKLDKIFRVIHCGQISVQKGVHVLIRAFSELRLPDSELWLIGGLTPEIANFLRDYPDSNIFVKGPFPQNQLPDYYSQGSVFCMASLQEGLAMVIPQALACGLPVIATANSGAAEVVEEGRTGFIVPAGDLNILKDRILHLYQHPEIRDGMSETLSNSPGCDLSWSRYGNQIVDAYRNVVGRRPEQIPGS